MAEIRSELNRATARRAELWQQLARERGAAGAAEIARLTARVDELWSELRTAQARERFGSPELIVRRAARERRVERELEKLMTTGPSRRKAA